MRELITLCLLTCLASQAVAANWWDEWQYENKWTDSHDWWGPAPMWDARAEGETQQYIDEHGGVANHHMAARHEGAFRTAAGGGTFKWKRNVVIQRGVNSILHLEVNTCDYPDFSGVGRNTWSCSIVVNGEKIWTKNIVSGDWQDFDIDLSAYRGAINLEMWNGMAGPWPFALWDNVCFMSSAGTPASNPSSDHAENQGKTSAKTRKSRPLGF